LQSFAAGFTESARRRVSYTISLTINLFTAYVLLTPMGMEMQKLVFPGIAGKDCKEKIARNSCLSFYVLTECSAKVRTTASVPLEPDLD
jgi:hypothetical protein